MLLLFYNTACSCLFIMQPIILDYRLYYSYLTNSWQEEMPSVMVINHIHDTVYIPLTITLLPSCPNLNHGTTSSSFNLLWYVSFLGV